MLLHPEPKSMEEEQQQPFSLLHQKHIINGRLPPDSLLQIWARLPLKSLFKFRAVCKLWNFSIISDPLLSTLRHFLSPPPPPPNLLLFLRHNPDEIVNYREQPILLSVKPINDVVSLDLDPNPNPIKNGFTPYVDSSIDLLPSKGPIVCFASDKYFYLCNPSTQEFLRVDNSQGQNCLFTSTGAFGYLGHENRYILARFSDPGRCEFLEFGPGQLGFNSWRLVNDECNHVHVDHVDVRGFGLMVGSVFYWKLDTKDGKFVLYLDTKDEKFGLISRPESNNENEVILYEHLYLVEFKGSLCAVDNFSRPPRMEIWMLNRNEVDSFWVRKYNIFISGMGRDLVYPFCDYEGENGGEIVLCNGTRSRLYCYNFKNRSIKQVYKPKNRTSDHIALYTPGPFPLSIAG